MILKEALNPDDSGIREFHSMLWENGDDRVLELTALVVAVAVVVVVVVVVMSWKFSCRVNVW